MTSRSSLVSGGRKPGARKLLLAAPRRAAVDLRPLLEAYATREIAHSHWECDAVPSSDELQTRAEGFDAVFVVGAPGRAPRTVLDGPVLRLDGAAAIPVGWLPYVDSAALSRFARAAAHLHRQAGEISSIALLSQRNGRYLRLADRLDELLRDTGDTFRWTADALTPEDLITALGSGLGCAIYVGHGRAVGWVGYYGLRAHHFAEFQGRPTGAILSLCCKTASRRRVGLSFAEALPLQGVCGAVLAAVGATLHTDNVRWAVRLSDALVAGAPDVGRLVCAALPLGEKPVADYRIIGDPLSPVLSSVSGARRAREVRTFS